MGNFWGTDGEIMGHRQAKDYLDSINVAKEFLPTSNNDDTTAANITTRYPIASIIPNNTAASQDLVKSARRIQMPTSFIGRPATFS